MADTLKPGFAGSFYPADPNRLEVMVRGFLEKHGESFPSALGMIVPHAGYIYSGKTAGMGFSCAPDRVSTVVVLAPSHRRAFQGTTVFDIDFVETPLGKCAVNRRITGNLASEMDTSVFAEHSFEVMIPFIQLRWPGVPVVPVIFGIEPDCERVALLIQKYAPDAFVVASSDLSHFYSLDVARKLDKQVIDAFISLSPDRIDSNTEACGRAPVKTLLHLAAFKNATEAVPIHYSTSADAGGGEHEVVGYFAGMVLG